MARTISFKIPDKNKDLFHRLLNEIRIYALSVDSSPCSDRLEIAHDYLYMQEMSGRIADSDLFIQKLHDKGFTDTQSVIEYTQRHDDIIPWH